MPYLQRFLDFAIIKFTNFEFYLPFAGRKLCEKFKKINISANSYILTLNASFA